LNTGSNLTIDAELQVFPGRFVGVGMSSTENQTLNALVATQSQGAERRGKSGIVVATYIIATVAAMFGWLYLLGNVLMIGIWKFARLAAYVLFE
jgi:hypothetical protein